ncbi:MAG: hypothetical protein WAQ27_00090 [Candidatus Microsaccharimonas sp.]
MKFELTPSIGILGLPEPSRKSRVETYLYDEASFNAEEIAKELREPGRPLEKTVVAIPVAAHQESGVILQTLEAYSQQVNADPFSVCLFLNYPYSESDNPAIQKTVDTVAIAQDKYADTLDVRIALQS